MGYIFWGFRPLRSSYEYFGTGGDNILKWESDCIRILSFMSDYVCLIYCMRLLIS